MSIVCLNNREEFYGNGLLLYYQHINEITSIMLPNGELWVKSSDNSWENINITLEAIINFIHRKSTINESENKKQFKIECILDKKDKDNFLSYLLAIDGKY